MGIREWVNGNPRITAGVIGALAITATVGVVMQVMASRKRFPTKLPDAYYTVDDGKTFFADSLEKVPPFDHNGKPAVHAWVFECNGRRFVGYVDRYSTEALKQIAAGHRTPDVELRGRELKKPGAATWVKSTDLAGAAAVMDVRCPDGRRAEPLEPD